MGSITFFVNNLHNFMDMFSCVRCYFSPPNVLFLNVQFIPSHFSQQLIVYIVMLIFKNIVCHVLNYIILGQFCGILFWNKIICAMKFIPCDSRQHIVIYFCRNEFAKKSLYISNEIQQKVAGKP